MMEKHRALHGKVYKSQNNKKAHYPTEHYKNFPQTYNNKIYVLSHLNDYEQ